jgi:hypothetical protein
MKLRFVIWVILFLSFFSSNLFSQSVFLEKGEAGFFVSGGYNKFELGEAFSIGGGFTLGGVFEIGFSKTNTTAEIINYYYTRDIEIQSNTISLGVVLVKKTIELQANASYTTFDGPVDVLTIGFSVGRKINFQEKLSLTPIFSFGLAIPQGENSGDPTAAVSLALPVLVGGHVYLGPAFGLSDGDLSWGAIAGVMVSFDLKRK